jgi:tRNA pseudouridine32 synthase/23S rRNA pseudouridine746 synthase
MTADSRVPELDGTELLYADDALLVLNKPAGLLSVPGRGEDKQDCLSARVQRHLPEACVVHRLDMATSGLLLMARSAAVQRVLNESFASRQVHKRYEAVVAGSPQARPSSDGWQEIDLPILLDWPNRPRRIIDPLLGKASLTRWQLVSVDAGSQTSRLRLEPVTGRSHQLRVHLLAIGHAILGDALYAPAEHAARSGRLLLHASQLRLLHPVSQAPLQFDSAAPF